LGFGETWLFYNKFFVQAQKYKKRNVDGMQGYGIATQDIEGISTFADKKRKKVAMVLKELSPI
jgi:ABC-type nitrate/sulfonate/bicarbonate transport system substrate-binding protein